MKNVTDILERLGGVTAVANALGLSYQTVHSWIARGFPASRCVALRDLARKNGSRLTVEQILAAKPDRPTPKRREAAASA